MRLFSAVFISIFLIFSGCGSQDSTPKSNDINNTPEPSTEDINSTPNTPPFNPKTAQACVPSGVGVDYQVGPNKAYKKLSDINWDNLKAGDSVRIFYKPTPYKEKIVIRTSGTKEKPLRICGVAGVGGERPILDGDGAVNDPDDSSAYTQYKPMEGLAMIMIYNRDYETKDSYITIDGLHIKNAKKGFSYKRVNGDSDEYEDGAACIRIQAGDNIIIRNNELENCGNGIFTMAQGYNEAHLTRNLLIEGNYLHGHSQPESSRHHALYIQAIGAIYQYNYFGPNDPLSQGTTLKERVAGSIIRYNWFDSGSSRSLDLVEVEDAAPWYIEKEYRKWAINNGGIDENILEKVKKAEKAYRSTHVYGNFFNHVGSKTVAGSLVHYGWDNDIELAREGKLYFFNNTVSILNDKDDDWRFRIFDMRLAESTPIVHSKETIEVFNNIIYFASEKEGGVPSNICMSNNSGTVNLGKNWISSGWNTQETDTECYPYADIGERPTINGAENTITSQEVPIDLETLLPKDIPSIKNQALPLPENLTNFPLTYQYIKHLNFKQRADTNDLGAAAIP